MGQKRLIIISAVLAVAILAVLHLTLVSAEVGIEDAPPVPAAEFGGTVKMNGNNVPTDGSAMVSAWINEMRYGAPVRPSLDAVSGDTVYHLSVPGDDPTTSEKEGGGPEDTVIFKVGTSPAGQSAWDNTGGLISLDLTAYTVYVPFSSK